VTIHVHQNSWLSDAQKSLPDIFQRENQTVNALKRQAPQGVIGETGCVDLRISRPSVAADAPLGTSNAHFSAYPTAVENFLACKITSICLVPCKARRCPTRWD
jgi:hypothetical protein